MKKVVAERNDVVFYIKHFPLVDLHPEAYGVHKSIACASTDSQALLLLEKAYDHKDIGKPECESTVVDESIRLGQSLGINSTPTVILQDGSRIMGAVQAGELVKAMIEAAGKQASR